MTVTAQVASVTDNGIPYFYSLVWARQQRKWRSASRHSSSDFTRILIWWWEHAHLNSTKSSISNIYSIHSKMSTDTSVNSPWQNYLKMSCRENACQESSWQLNLPKFLRYIRTLLSPSGVGGGICFTFGSLDVRNLYFVHFLWISNILLIRFVHKLCHGRKVFLYNCESHIPISMVQFCYPYNNSK